MAENVYCGVVFFDNPKEHQSGWALAWDDGDRKPVRIASTADLNSGVVWWTNLDYEASKLSGLEGSRFRRDSYFLCPQKRIWTELGLDDSDDGKIRADADSVFGGMYKQPFFLRLATLAWFFDSYWRITRDFVPLAAPPSYDVGNEKNGLRARILPDYRNFFADQPDDVVLEALAAADIPYQPVSRSIDNGFQKSSRIIMDRVSHALNLLAVMFPIGGWRNLGKAGLLTRRGPEFLSGWLDEHPGALLRVVMRRCDPVMEPIINFGGDISGNSRAAHWLSAAEVNHLLPWCDFVIHEVILGETLSCGFEFLKSARLELDPETVVRRSASFSYGYFLETMWRSLIGRIPGAPVGVRSPVGVFLRSADRVLLFESVVQLYRLGLGVTGYGSGGINVVYPEDMQVNFWVPEVLRLGMIPPFQPYGLHDTDWVQDVVSSNWSHERTPEPVQLLQMSMLMGDLSVLVQAADELSLWRPDKKTTT